MRWMTGGLALALAGLTAHAVTADGESRPGMLRQMRLEIMSGGGQAVVRNGIERGVLTDGEDIAELNQMVKDYSSTPVLDGILQSETYKQGMEQLKIQTRVPNKDNPFAPVSISTLGQNLQYELTHQMLKWAAANPNATYDQAQDQLNKKGHPTAPAPALPLRRAQWTQRAGRRRSARSRPGVCWALRAHEWPEARADSPDVAKADGGSSRRVATS